MEGPNREQEITFTQIFINNEWIDSLGEKTFEIINPTTAEKIADVQEGEQDDIDLAVAAARDAFQTGSKWRTMDASARGLLMHKLANLVERDIEILANLMSLECGKVYKDGLIELHFTLNLLRYYAGWADKISGKTVPADGSMFVYTRQEAVGVAGLIIAWNFPVSLMFQKLSPALSAGCTVVVKPSEKAPLSCLHIASLVKEAGFPPGVVNMVPGFGPTCGEPLAAHMDVDMISFTGSNEVGQTIQSVAGQSNSKRVTLETGGKNAVVVCADADVDEAVSLAHMAALSNNGHICTCGTRTFVHEDIYDEFVEKSRDMAGTRVIGDPFDEDTMAGPIGNKDLYDKILELIESGKEEGATLETGGEPTGDVGFLISPAVFSGVEDNMRIAKEEIFGPVQVILKWSTLTEVIERTNSLPFGLAAGILTNNIKTALTFAHNVRVGFVWINSYLTLTPQSPFGGFKMSGFGRELGYEGLLPYLDVKTVSIKIPQKNS